MCGSAPSAPQLPQYPNLTGAEQTNLGQQAGAAAQTGSVIQGLSGQLGNNQNILQMISGLFNSDGSINQNALTQLQQQAGQSSQTAGTQGQAALSGLGGTQQSLASTNQAYQNALQGNVPQNQQLQFQQNQSFQQMQEQAAQQGIQINGTNFSDAVSSSSAGQKLIQNFQQNANIQNQNYALGYTQQLAGNASQLAGAQGTQANTGMGLSSYGTQTPLSYLQGSITNGQGALAPFLSNYQNQLSSAYSPLYQQQIGPYQQQMAQAQANYQGAMGQYNANEGQIGMGFQLLSPLSNFGSFFGGSSGGSGMGYASAGGGAMASMGAGSAGDASAAMLA